MQHISGFTKVIKIFVFYSNKDEKLKDELLDHLSPWIRQGIIESWDNRQITAGSEKESEILKHINAADIILCLLSSDLLKPEYYDTVEMQRAWSRRETGEAEIIPVLLRAVEWRATPFRNLQIIPRDHKSIKYRSNRDKIFVEIAREIEMVIEALKKRKA
jgi:hypothetical protein